MNIDQIPLGGRPGPTRATYTCACSMTSGDLFASAQEAKSRDYFIGQFRSTSGSGRCEGLPGDGLPKIEMHFLPDIFVLRGLWRQTL